MYHIYFSSLQLHYAYPHAQLTVLKKSIIQMTFLVDLEQKSVTDPCTSMNHINRVENCQPVHPHTLHLHTNGWYT